MSYSKSRIQGYHWNFALLINFYQWWRFTLWSRIGINDGTVLRIRLHRNLYHLMLSNELGREAQVLRNWIIRCVLWWSYGKFTTPPVSELSGWSCEREAFWAGGWIWVVVSISLHRLFYHNSSACIQFRQLSFDFVIERKINEIECKSDELWLQDGVFPSGLALRKFWCSNQKHYFRNSISEMRNYRIIYLKDTHVL